MSDPVVDASESYREPDRDRTRTDSSDQHRYIDEYGLRLPGPGHLPTKEISPGVYLVTEDFYKPTSYFAPARHAAHK